MRFLKRFWARLMNVATRRQDDQRLREEIEAHLALQTADNLRAGMAPEEARRRAVLKSSFCAEHSIPVWQPNTCASRCSR